MSVAVVKLPFGTSTAVFDSLAHRGDTVSSLAHRECQAVATVTQIRDGAVAQTGSGVEAPASTLCTVSHVSGIVSRTEGNLSCPLLSDRT